MVDRTDQERRDFEDQQNELAGRETGRRARFGVGTTQTQATKEREKKERAYRDALELLLLNDPEYRALHKALGDELSNAETHADTRIATLQTSLSAQLRKIQSMRDKAPKIDGKAVFPTSDGRVVDEDGIEIMGVDVADINWPEGSVSAEAYEVALDHESALQSELSDWTNYRNDTLGEIRNRHEDGENPTSKEQMEQDLQTIQSTTERLTASSVIEAIVPDVSAQPVADVTLPMSLE